MLLSNFRLNCSAGLKLLVIVIFFLRSNDYLRLDGIWFCFSDHLLDYLRLTLLFALF